MTPPPSPRSLATSSDGTAQSCLDDEEDPHVDALERIFTPEVFDRFMWVWGQQLHQSVIAEALKFVLEQTRKHDLDAPSKTDLLHHFGVQSGDLVHRLCNLVGCMFRCPFGHSNKVNHLHNIESLARVYCEENPDGGVGYSFGALLDRYLFFHLIYFPQQIGVEACLIGGENRPHIEGGDHKIDQDHRVRRAGGVPDANVTLHWVRGRYLVRAGVGPVYGRVTKGLRELLGELDPNRIYLCHGTTIAHASAIVRQGPKTYVGAMCTDFGPAFYLTNSFDYAVSSGYMVSGGRSDTAVVVFPVPRAALVADRTLELTDDAWQQVLCHCRRGKSIENTPLNDAYDNAECIIGPISGNAEQVDTGKHEARASDFQQWAFKGKKFAKSIFGEIINSGAVHVFRVVHEREEEWQGASVGGPQGRRGRRGRRGLCLRR